MTTLLVTNPYDGSLVCELPLDQGADLRRKLDRAVAAKRAWREVSLAERTRSVASAVSLRQACLITDSPAVMANAARLRSAAR